MEDRKDITLVIDGACSGNPGPGGWAAILSTTLKNGEPYRKELTGYELGDTSGNRMELTALVEAVKTLKMPCNVTIRTSNKFICTGIASAKERYQNGWKTKTGAKCKHFDLWQELADVGIKGHHRYYFEYVPVNSDDESKEACKLARAQIKAVR